MAEQPPPTLQERVLRECRWEPKLELVRNVYRELTAPAGNV